MADVGQALLMVEPLCAGLCASRPDRKKAVVPELKDAHAQAVDLHLQDDMVAFADSMRRFHESLVELCGNETLIVVVGSLESLWSHGEAEWAVGADAKGSASTDKHGPASLSAHEEMIELITRGDAAAVRELARAHLERTLFYADAASADARVSVSPLPGADGLNHRRDL
jgi:DNA-binding GntR family transcriptional regulator